MRRECYRVALDLDARERVLALLKRHGWNATSFQVLEPGFDYWFGHDACVAYVDTGSAWVVAGGPICDPARVDDVVRDFLAAAPRRTTFFAVQRDFLPRMKIGEQPWWDPRDWETRHRGHRGLREQVRRARAKGLVVERMTPESRDDFEAIERLIRRWLATKRMPPMAFLVELHPFLFPDERRYYIARTGDAIAGALVAVPVYRRNGWFLEDLLRDPTAPNGTTESLVDFAMRDVARDGAEYVTLGLAPLAGDEPWLRVTRALAKSFYNFDGLRAFKAKFRPDGWDAIYLARRPGASRIVALYDALSAFARGRPLRFGAQALLRERRFVIASLAVLLVPWTFILATVPAERWFPSRNVQRAWVAFDIAIALTLFRLARRYQRPLALAAATATSIDVVLTATQAAVHNLPRRRGWRDLAVIAASIAAPLLATVVLRGTMKQ